jgi:hypothetical protein
MCGICGFVGRAEETLVFALWRARPATAGPRGGSPDIYDLGPVARPSGHLDHRLGVAPKLARWAVGRASRAE